MKEKQIFCNLYPKLKREDILAGRMDTIVTIK